MKSEVLPIGVRLSGLRVLVVGRGAAAEERVRPLLAGGAEVVVVSPEPTEALSALSAQGILALRVRDFENEDFTGVSLAVLTDLDPLVAERMDLVARSRGTLFCAVDQPSFGSFSHLALARAGDLTVAVSTNGRAPALARRLREEFERVLGASRAAAFVERLGALRDSTASIDRKRVLGEAVASVRLTGELSIPED